MVDRNILYNGDNLDVLRRHVKDESVDLVYLDPPFNSNADYNVLFGHADGSRAAAQIKAFDDTWRWDQAAAAAFQDVVIQGGQVAQALVAFQTLLEPSTMFEYLSMMAPRLIGLHRVLKPSGSIYLHCDPTASHDLKLLMDAVFGAEHFRNDITWKRKAGRGETLVCLAKEAADPSRAPSGKSRSSKARTSRSPGADQTEAPWALTSGSRERAKSTAPAKDA
jgi:site-specific DNA-methyltransferase (adenine-specific)